MASLTSGGESDLRVRRAVGAVEIILVTADAGGVRAGQVVIVVDVAA